MASKKSQISADVAVISLDMYNDASRLIDSNFDGESDMLGAAPQVQCLLPM